MTNPERIKQLIDYLSVLVDLKHGGTQCNKEINAIMAELNAELIEKK
ncbi:hypothetical protein [Indiicoccus explosivorum]|nr:hypothetical protein [Indiicoccus explosivorum]